MTDSGNPSSITLTDRLRKAFKWLIDPLAGFFNRLGVHPNAMTFAGLVGTVIGAYFLAVDRVTIGGLIILVAAPFDVLDGSMARLRGEASAFGGFADSVTDRYAELFIFGGLLYNYLGKDDLLSCMVIFLAAAGSLMVSYVKARAESLQFEAKIGLLSRVERYLVLVPCLIFNIPMVAVYILAFFANFTALQRIWHVRRQAYTPESTSSKE